ncbi:hypothetical protein KKC88_00760 [Patescibacteria group bacterium]|nr:hypothetical protein [Patescibacteria group bacterium]MBU1673756.1 hypothetical protein [Patescibacteria group bacterium]MBU1964096.1 hypothetical protein [Patescibacteria group bacterium]
MEEARALKPVWFFEFSFSFLCIAIGILLKFLELNLNMEFKMSSLVIIIIAAIIVGPGGVALYHITKKYDLKVYAIMLVSGVNICGLVALPLLGWNWFYFLFFLAAIILFFIIRPKQKADVEKA